MTDRQYVDSAFLEERATASRGTSVSREGGKRQPGCKAAAERGSDALVDGQLRRKVPRAEYRSNRFT
jgi:hypothetical protein